jgi:hypothetical protein
MITKEKGNIGEAIVLAEFTKRGIQCCLPFGDSARYDLIAEFNGKLNKIQIKYCGQITKHNSVECPCASSTNHTTNKHYTTYENDVDYIACYIVPLDKVILIPIEEIGSQKSITIRLSSPLNGQTKNIHIVDDFDFDTILKSDKD